ncbi:hypothetical protein V8E53_000057 [Lactarius tabidus]
MHSSRRRLGPNAPPDDDNPHSNLPPSFPARFMSVLDLYRAQRDTPSQVQDAPPPSPTFRVQYQPDAPPVYHTLFAILSSQATVVAQEEMDAIRAAVPSPPNTPTPEVILEAVERVLPALTPDTINSSVLAMERIVAESSNPADLELADIPPQVWAALRVAVPSKGSSIHDSISRASSFAEARDSIRSAESSPMNESPTNGPLPLFLPGSSGNEQLSTSYHPESIEVASPQQQVIGDHQNPIYVHSSSPGTERLAITQHLETASASLRVETDRLTPVFQQQDCSQAASSNLRTSAGDHTRNEAFHNMTEALNEDAIATMRSITDELNQAVEGHSHYFLQEPLNILYDPAFPIKSEELRRILDIAAAVLSGGPCSDQNDLWATLRPSDWYRASTHILASVLRGAVRTKQVGKKGDFPIEPLRDAYLRSNLLPKLETQRDLLEAIALQIAEQLTLDNGPYLPQDSVDGIRATVWRAHEAQIRAAVTRKANEVEDRITTMGLAELIDNLLNEATTQEITATIKDDIALQVRSKYNNARLEEESKAYNAFIKEATKDGKARAAAEALQAYATTSATLKDMKERQAHADADVYYRNLLEKAKSQARLQADSDYSRLLADARSEIAPRIDKEIAEEHLKLLEERRQATSSGLQALTLDAEKECVIAAAIRLGLDIQGNGPPQKKVKTDQRKARPAPITPRGRSNSIVSATSTSSRKRAYSPSKVNSDKARDEQKTPTPEDVSHGTSVTTVNFSIKQEGTPSPFPTPSTPSVIQHAVDSAMDFTAPPQRLSTIPPTSSTIRKAVILATDLVPTPTPSQESIPPLRGLSSSIHNVENQMAIERDSFDPASIFPPGIPAPPRNVSLPPAMSRTPQFGGAEAMEDGVAPSCSPEVELRSAVQISVDATIGRCLQPLWETIHRLESLLTHNIPRAPPRAGPGYRAEHIQPAPTVSSAAIAPRLTSQGTKTHDNTKGATPFPSAAPVAQNQEESHARVDNEEEFPTLTQSRGTRRRQNAQARAHEARRSVPGATGDDDGGHIPITNNNSRIRPLFANVITQSAVAQQQQVQRSAAQARAVQGRKPAGNQGARPSKDDANLTEVTVIRFGGLDNDEEERKFRARNPAAIVQAVQRELGKRAKNPPAVLSGRWSTTSQITGNFVYTLAGIIPPRDLMTLKPFLCSPFKGRTELVPTKGWTWIQLRGVPTEDVDGKVWGPEDLLAQFVANPCFQDALICIAPHWQGNPLNNDKLTSTVLAAIIDEDNHMCQNALTHGVRMFGTQVKFLHCGDNPSLLQCARCHLLGHYANSSKCKLPKGQIKCYRCSGPHDGRQHDYECNAKSHKMVGKCDCILKCLLCKKPDHHARSRKCLKRGDFQPPRLPELSEEIPFQTVGKKRSTKGKERQERYSPPLSAFIVPEVKTIPLPNCPVEEGKNVLLCMCCALPSVAEYKKRFVSPHPIVNDVTAIPTARIVSSKGKSVLDLYPELGRRKAYGTAILAGDEEARTALRDMDKHDDEEIMRMLEEAEEESS